MAPDCGMLHELWEYVEDGMSLRTFCLAGAKGDEARKRLPADATLVWTVWGVSHFEAMTRYYEHQGWRSYSAQYARDREPYPAEWLQEQQQFLASFARN